MRFQICVLLLLSLSSHEHVSNAFCCKEYAEASKELVKLRREAKVNGNFFVEPEARFLRTNHASPTSHVRPAKRKLGSLNWYLSKLGTGFWIKSQAQPIFSRGLNFDTCPDKSHLQALRQCWPTVVNERSIPRGKAAVCRSYCGHHQDEPQAKDGITGIRA